MTLIIIFVSFIIFSVVVFIVAPIIFLWLLVRLREAAKYRESQKTATPTQDQWTITYKDGSKMGTATVTGLTEGDAIKDLLSKGVRYTKIISITK